MKTNSRTRRRQCQRCQQMTANAAKIPFCGACLRDAPLECEGIRALRMGQADVKAGRLIDHDVVKREMA